MSDASWFVDDVGAYDKYEREEEPAEPQKVNIMIKLFLLLCILYWTVLTIQDSLLFIGDSHRSAVLRNLG